ncbi:homeobox-DDT domain protein RLT3 isoform X2 [Sesamum indicum]|uniref:Homeobox-DDT domain protein RLT3 isoform X2 n=1 Tax=Sesamum indicum TaxID=4182 RepID=A0A6I9T2P6_SESIN|nr:homeobox-DDT domain protein RLT3 isoform X2 [Sesamum indicum]
MELIMAKQKPNSNTHKCTQEFGNGLNSDVIHYSRRNAVGRKRKSKQHQQLFMSENDYKLRLQEVLYTPDYILTKFFRKDGPPLGDHFDSLPSNAFSCGPSKSHHEDNRNSCKRRKVSMHAILDYQACCENSSPAQRHGIGKGPMTANGAPIKKHGMGKGLMTQKGAPGKKHGRGKGFMTVWQGTNHVARDFAYGANSSELAIQKKKNRVQPRESLARRLANKEQARRKTAVGSRKVERQKLQKQKQKQPHKEKCELALEDAKCLENTEQFALLMDDEELELRDLQAGPKPLSCCAHFPTNASHGCSLCKDLLAKFPPNSVTMKLPLSIPPWVSSPELVIKFFKVFHFLCTYAVTISIHSFTLDEFAQAFHDKDSLLLGQVHLALLKLLLSDIDKELSRGFLSHASKNCKFLGLLHSLEHNGSILEFWQNSLNLLTWTEILRQVLVAAGFGAKHGMTRKTICNKEVNLMDKYGLSPGTLKGELFSLLLTQGNSGMKVSELAKSSSIVELNLTDTLPDLENLVTSALSGDITLFEKISSSGYRLRIHAVEKECEDCPSDSEDFGSMDDISEVTGGDDANDSEYETLGCSPSKTDVGQSNMNMLRVYNEIDESNPGEVWLLGLMESEYSDLSIEEKLNALVALIDLLGAGSSIRMEDPLMSSTECPPNTYHHGSGAKIKRSIVKQYDSLGLSGSRAGQTFSGPDVNIPEQPIDSLVPMSKIGEEEKFANMKRVAKQMEAELYLHPMQSIFLGSDRRYNRYWLFLGPCDELDPGHRRIYFESSEDGHWEMIDTKEAFSTLLSALDRRGAREARLLASLEKRESSLIQVMSNTPNDGGNRQLAQSDQSELNTSREDSSSPVSDVDNRSSLSEMQNELPSSTSIATVDGGKKGEQLLEKPGHSQAFGAWIWKSFYSELNSVKIGKKAYLDSLRRCDQCQDLYWRDEKHCRICHTTFELDFDLEERYAVHSAVCQANKDVNKCRKQRVLSSQLQALKAAIYAIESAIPEDALMGSWKRSAHNLWVNRLRRASNLREFLQVLADLVTAIDEDWFYRNNISDSYCALEEIISNFSTMPQTYSAVALWLVKLDSLIASRVESRSSQPKSGMVHRLEDGL